jgi:hypothetical protein
MSMNPTEFEQQQKAMEEFFETTTFDQEPERDEAIESEGDEIDGEEE